VQETGEAVGILDAKLLRTLVSPADRVSPSFLRRNPRELRVYHAEVSTQR